MADQAQLQAGDPYWTSRQALFNKEEGDDGDANLKEATKNYATAWSIFAALLMTVSFSLIPVDQGSFTDDNGEDANRIMSYIYIGLLLVSTSFSFLAVLVGTYRYTYFDGIPAPMMDVAIEAMSMPGSELMVYPAMGTQFLASVIGCYLFHGAGMLVMALLIFFVVFVPGFGYVVYRYKQSVNGVPGLQMGAVVNAGAPSQKNVMAGQDNERTDLKEEEET